MEKQYRKPKFRRTDRLLKFILFIYLLFFLNFFLISEHAIEKNTAIPVNENNFVGEECIFEIRIPDAESSSVITEISEIPEYMKFISLNKFDYSGKTSGTLINISFIFLQSGTFRISPLSVYINGEKYLIPFADINILKPATPEASILFWEKADSENEKLNLVSGEKQKFTIYLQNILEITSFSWEIPKDALLKELKRFEISKDSIKKQPAFSKIPIAEFEYIPIIAGKIKIPQFKIIVISCEGIKTEIFTPEISAEVIPAQKIYAEKKSAYFENAFANVQSMEKKERAILYSECQKIAGLRRKERAALPLSKVKNERISFEKEIGCTNKKNEPSMPILYFFITASIIFFIAFLIFMILKKKSDRFIFLSGAFTFFILASIYAIIICRKIAIFTGAGINSIPEKNAELLIPVKAGSRVRIIESAGNNFYIKYENLEGWTTKEFLIFIN